MRDPLGVAIQLFASVMFVVTHPTNVVPACRVVALEALVDARMLLASDLLRDHREVSHGVTRRRLMALHAFLRCGRRVFVANDSPGLEDMALRAVATEMLEMRVPAIVTAGAIERFARGRCIELFRASNTEPGLKRLECRGAVGVRARARQRAGTETSELYVVHYEWPDTRVPMLKMACRALCDARVERSRLSTE